jgi:hypothetical protein
MRGIAFRRLVGCGMLAMLVTLSSASTHAQDAGGMQKWA